MFYEWSVDGTQSDELQLTIMIYSGHSNLLSSEFIGEFVMFFKDINEIRVFFLNGLEELQQHNNIMKKLDSLRRKEKTE